MGKGQVKDKKSKLKMIVFTSAFFATWAATIGLCMGASVKGMQIKDNVENSYKETDVYHEYLNEKNADIQNRLDSNEITEEQAKDERENLDSWDSLKESILKDNPENIQFQDMLNEYDKFDTIRFVTLMLTSVFNIGFASYNIARLVKVTKKRKQFEKELNEKIKDQEENIKIENERRDGKQLDDYSEVIKD